MIFVSDFMTVICLNTGILTYVFAWDAFTSSIANVIITIMCLIATISSTMYCRYHTTMISHKSTSTEARLTWHELHPLEKSWWMKQISPDSTITIHWHDAFLEPMSYQICYHRIHCARPSKAVLKEAKCITRKFSMYDFLFILKVR